PAPVSAEAVHGLVERIAALAVDEAAILTSFHPNALPLALLLRLAGVRTIAAISEDYPGSLLDVRHHVPPGRHEVERALSIVKTLGYELPAGDGGNLAVRVPPSGRVLDQLGMGTPYVVVHPGASVPARAWSPRQHRDLVAALARTRAVVVTGGPDERALTAAVALGAGVAHGSGAGPVVDAGGRLSFAELASVLARADAAVVANTGPAHLAAAVGTPVVS